MADFTPSEMQRLLSSGRDYAPRSTTPFKLAGAAALIAAGLDYPLGKKFPLSDPDISMPTRMAVTGGLVFISVLLAAQFTQRD